MRRCVGPERVCEHPFNAPVATTAASCGLEASALDDCRTHLGTDARLDASGHREAARQ